MLNKIAKKVFVIAGIFFTALVFLINLFYISKINIYEYVSTNLYSAIGVVCCAIIIWGLVLISQFLKKFFANLKMWEKVLLLIALLTLYVVVQIEWINVREANPGWDQKWVYENAVKMYNEQYFSMDRYYLQLCQHQLPLASLYLFIFKLFNCTDVILLQYINAIANAFSILRSSFDFKTFRKKV